MKYFLVLAALLLVFQSACATPPTPTPTPTPTASPTYSAPELEYLLIAKYPDLFW